MHKVVTKVFELNPKTYDAAIVYMVASIEIENLLEIIPQLNDEIEIAELSQELVRLLKLKNDAKKLFLMQEDLTTRDVDNKG
jgi:hypothetical protein